MYNKVEGVGLNRAREDRLNHFMRILADRGVTATVRRSRGDDIDAGCGQLAIREGQPRGKSMRPSERDRKSTRLNSSHVAISYAVFCLKKKRKSNRKRQIKTFLSTE